MIKEKAKTTANNIVDRAKKSANKVKEKVKENPKTGLYVVGGLVGVTALVFLIKGLNKGVKEVFTAEDNQETIPDTGGISNAATISNQTAINYAQQLLDAMNHLAPFWGTDEDKIEAVFNNLKNGDDFIKVYNAFGNRNYNGYNSPPDSWVGQAIDVYQERNLVYWLNSELSSVTEPTLYNKVKQRVESAGFSF